MAPFIEDLDLWRKSIVIETPFYVVGVTNVVFLQNNNQTASYIDLRSSLFCKLLNEGYGTRKTETKVSCVDHLITSSFNEENRIYLIKNDLTDHQGLHHITSYDLKGDEKVYIMFQLGFSKIIDAQCVCLFPSSLHSDLQQIAYEHQSIDDVATDRVFKLRTSFGNFFAMKQVANQQEKFILPPMIKNDIKIGQKF